MFTLQNRTIVLTGAAGLLGSAMSRAILDAGATLVAVGRSSARLELLRNDLEPQHQERCRIVAADVTEEEGVESIRRVAESVPHGIHGLVNNAYAGIAGPVEAIGPEDFASACRYNLSAPFSLTMALAPSLSRGAETSGTSSSVVNVASMYGSVSPDPALYGTSGMNNPVHYGATKGGLIQMTRYLACHLVLREIRCNSIAPGPFPDLSREPAIPQFHERLAAKVPMKRVGRPHEVAGPTVFLLSDGASFVNGANLPVDGGWTAW